MDTPVTGNPDHQRLKSLCISIRTHLLGRGYDVFHPTTGEASFFNHELPNSGIGGWWALTFFCGHTVHFI